MLSLGWLHAGIEAPADEALRIVFDPKTGVLERCQGHDLGRPHDGALRGQAELGFELLELGVGLRHRNGLLQLDLGTIRGGLS